MAPADVAAEFGWTEDDVIARLSALLESGMLTRFGPLFQIERAGGCFVLAAMAVPPERFDEITAKAEQLGSNRFTAIDAQGQHGRAAANRFHQHMRAAFHAAWSASGIERSIALRTASRICPR